MRTVPNPPPAVISDSTDFASENPKHIWIEPTNRCNTRCIHCEHFYKSYGEHMPLELYEKIAAAVLDGVERVELIGYGEPFMAPGFERMFSDCVERGIEIFTTTNGILLRKDELVSRIVRNRVALCLSIDGARAETFETVRPFIKWPKLIETLECIKRNADAAGPEKRFRLRFNFVAMKMNFGDLPDLVRLAHRYGCVEIFILPLGGEEQFEKVTGQSLHVSPELVSPILMEALREAERLEVDLDVPPSFRKLMIDGPERGRGLSGRLARARRRSELALRYVRRNGVRSAFRRFTHSPKVLSKTGTSYCTMPWKDSYFASDGSVYPCCIMGEKLGNLKDQTWEDIWNGPAYRNLRRTIHSWNPSAVCRFCALPLGINGGDDKQHTKFFSRFRVEPIAVDDPRIDFAEGFYDLEYTETGNPSHRWMGREGRLALSVPAGARFLRLLLISRSPLPDANPGFCRVGSLPEEPFDNTCDQANFPLEGIGCGSVEVQIRMENSHVPEGDGRDLALAIRGVEFLF